MKTYDKYKPSGIDWIGDIPEHWSLATVGRVSNLGRGRVISALEIGENVGEFPVYSSQTENSGVMGYLNSYDFEGEYVTWTTDGANAGRVFHRTGKFNCTNVCGTLQPKNWEQIDLRFLPYFLNLGTKFSVRLDINPKLMNNMMAKIPLIIPSKEEQTMIANYLDEKTAQIDLLINNKLRLIELLKEERTAIINQAVTRGINPHAKLKPSDIAWLGDIPEHWEVKKLKYLLSKVIDNRGKTPPFGSNGIPMLEVKNITDGLKYPTERFEKYVEPEVVQRYERDKVQVGDLLISTVGATSGKVVIIKAKPEYFIAQNVVGLRTNESVNNLFFYYLLSSDYFFTSLKMINKSNTIDNLKVSIFINNVCLLPPFEEQKQIVEFVETATNTIDATIAQIEKEIGFVREYRTALISEVGTGKIKVV